MTELKGKVAIVTGGTKGLGKELVLQLAQAGTTIATIARKQTELDALRKEVKTTADDKHLFFTGDFKLEVDVRKFAAAIKKQFRRVDVLINNAGYHTGNALLGKQTVEAFSQQFGVHVLAPLILYQRLLPMLKKSKDGSIINILTDQAKISRSNWGPYSTTKHAEYGLGKVMAAEAAVQGIRVTNVILGGMNTTFRKEARPQYLQARDVAEACMQILQLPPQVFIPEIVIYPQCMVAQ
jgi:NAD(P)-dependent dehydrogenase (short-subunit alcohol dehydrogenase family)